MWETLRIIENMGAWKPEFVVWENVKGVLDYDMIESFNKYLTRIEELGYTNSYQVLNAMDFGIPQSRERVFVISSLRGHKFRFENLRKKPTRHISHFLETDVTDPKYMITIPSMLNRIKELSTIKQKYRYLDVIDQHCWTISTRQDRCPNAGIIRMGQQQYRYLTERECWRLMGFDDEDFEQILKEYPGRKNQRNATLYKLAGNSIVVDVLESIFEELLKLNQFDTYVQNIS